MEFFINLCCVRLVTAGLLFYLFCVVFVLFCFSFFFLYLFFLLLLLFLLPFFLLPFSLFSVFSRFFI